VDASIRSHYAGTSNVNSFLTIAPPATAGTGWKAASPGGRSLPRRNGLTIPTSSAEKDSYAEIFTWQRQQLIAGRIRIPLIDAFFMPTRLTA